MGCEGVVLAVPESREIRRVSACASLVMMMLKMWVMWGRVREAKRTAGTGMMWERVQVKDDERASWLMK